MAIDGSRVLPALVGRVVAREVEVESASTFEEAERLLTESPPDAVIVNIGPADLPWERLVGLCSRQGRKIPILYESCVFRSLTDAGIEAEEGCTFLAKPYPLEDLRRAVECLMSRVTEPGGARRAGKKTHPRGTEVEKDPTLTGSRPAR